jgi:hypothetical protein
MSSQTRHSRDLKRQLILQRHASKRARIAAVVLDAHAQPTHIFAAHRLSIAASLRAAFLVVQRLLSRP